MSLRAHVENRVERRYGPIYIMFCFNFQFLPNSHLLISRRSSRAATIKSPICCHSGACSTCVAVLPALSDEEDYLTWNESNCNFNSMHCSIRACTIWQLHLVTHIELQERTIDLCSSRSYIRYNLIKNQVIRYVTRMSVYSSDIKLLMFSNGSAFLKLDVTMPNREALFVKRTRLWSYITLSASLK